MKDPQYLGDGVYAHIDDFGSIVLTTGNHEPALADDKIVLEPGVVRALLQYIDKHQQNGEFLG